MEAYETLAIEQMKRSLGSYYFDAVVPEEFKNDLKFKKHSEKPIPLITRFLQRDEYDTNIPTPFIRLWIKIFEVFDEDFDTNNLGMSIDHFWRLYAVYKHGGSYKVALSQIKQSTP